MGELLAYERFGARVDRGVAGIAAVVRVNLSLQIQIIILYYYLKIAFVTFSCGWDCGMVGGIKKRGKMDEWKFSVTLLCCLVDIIASNKES